jgi:peptidoglycan/xylan/chitin deacetylase (PgdA/CDA1 family)
MKQIVEDILDSLILAHRLEVPTYMPIRTFMKIPIKEKLHILYDSPLVLTLRQGAATFLLIGGVVALASLGDRREVHNGDTDLSHAALTYDVGNDADYISRLFTILKRYEASTTILITKDWIYRIPEETDSLVTNGYPLENRRVLDLRECAARISP